MVDVMRPLLKAIENGDIVLGPKVIEKKIKKGEKIEKIYLPKDFEENQKDKVKKIINKIRKSDTEIIPLILTKEDLQEFIEEDDDGTI